jgi:hypothetical protein
MIKGYNVKRQYCSNCGRLENVVVVRGDIGRFSQKNGKQIYRIEQRCPKYSDNYFALFYNWHDCHYEEGIELIKDIDGDYILNQ